MQPLGKADIQLMDVCDYLSIQPSPCLFPRCMQAPCCTRTSQARRALIFPYAKPLEMHKNPKRNTHTHVLHRPG